MFKGKGFQETHERRTNARRLRHARGFLALLVGTFEHCRHFGVSSGGVGVLNVLRHAARIQYATFQQQKGRRISMQRVPCVAVIIKNHKGQVLLNLRDNRPDVAFANCWTLPGGRVELNETPQQAALRELSEETGLQIPLTFWKAYERHHPEKNAVVEQHVFVGNIDEKPKMVLGEGQALEFFGKEVIFTLPIAFGFEKVLGEFFAGRYLT